MKLNKTKWIAGMLCLLLLGSGLVGCNQPASPTETTADGNEKTAEPAATETTSVTEEPMTISWVSWSCGDIEEDNFCESWLQDQLGIEIETARVDMSEQEQVDLMLASGEMPDCGWIINKTPAEMDSQGLIRTISEEMIREYAPQYAALLDSDPLGWEINVSKDNGEYLALTGYTILGPGAAIYTSVYRYDWLQNVGVDPNGEVIQISDNIYYATESFTKSQLNDIFDKFTNGDPDGNGEIDTYAAAFSNNFSWPFCGVLSIFEINIRESMEVNGSAENYYVTPQYYNYLEFLAQLYAAGYIDPEFPTTSREESFQKVADGKSGYIGNAFTTVGNGSVTSFDNMVPEGGTALYVPTEINDDGTGGAPSYAATSFNYHFYVRSDVGDEKLAKILELFDFTNFDDEARLFLQWGVEGTHFEFTSDDGTYSPILLDGVAHGGATGIWSYNSGYITELRYAANAGYNKECYLVMSYLAENALQYQISPYRLDLFNETDLAELKALYDDSINTIVQEYFFNVVCGSVDLASTWDSYIESLNAAGYAELHDELQKAPLYSDLVP